MTNSKSESRNSKQIRNPKFEWMSLSLALLAVWVSSGEARAQAPDFETQVLPVLTRAGCNSGSCHGAAIGRGGFRLSLLGYDPETDHESLVRELEGRRVNLAQPEKSLVLRKPSGKLKHEGGVKLGASGEGHQILLDWIKAGAPRAARRTLVKLEVTPSRQLLQDVDDKFQLNVLARFSDGTSEDVTRWSLLTPTDDAALRASAKGFVTALRRGRNTLMVRFLGEVGAVTVTVPLHAGAAPKGDRPRANFIDDHVNDTLAQLHLLPSPRADDLTFVRRVHLDLLGTLPEPVEVKKFLADTGADRRERLIERLLERPEFVDYWTYKWGDLLRIESKRLQPQGASAFHSWVRDQVAKNTPLDRMARDMLLSLGDGHALGPVNFSRVPATPQAHAEYVSQVFLGARLQCANCHNHPLDRWTQDDYHGLAAIFAKLERGQTVKLQPRGEVIHPKTGKSALTRIPGTANLSGKSEPRAEFAKWLTAAENPFFARAAVNRLWRELMGRGLVEPVDDHRATNPPTHPELLDALARDLASNKYNLKRTIRLIVSSEAYQRSSLSTLNNRADDRFYAKALVRPLPPVVLVDAVANATGVAEKFGSLPEGTRAIALGDSRVSSKSLDLLGRCGRDGDCAPGGSGGTLALTLHTINGPWINSKIGDPKGRLHTLLKDKRSDDTIVAEFYQAALSRPPSAQEVAHWQKRFRAVAPAERGVALEDFVWALLNSAEFCSNH
jgi:hypothetical protein